MPGISSTAPVALAALAGLRRRSAATGGWGGMQGPSDIWGCPQPRPVQQARLTGQSASCPLPSHPPWMSDRSSDMLPSLLSIGVCICKMRIVTPPQECLKAQVSVHLGVSRPCLGACVQTLGGRISCPHVCLIHWRAQRYCSQKTDDGGNLGSFVCTSEQLELVNQHNHT